MEMPSIPPAWETRIIERGSENLLHLWPRSNFKHFLPPPAGVGIGYILWRRCGISGHLFANLLDTAPRLARLCIQLSCSCGTSLKCCIFV